jgi:hypothetical protein
MIIGDWCSNLPLQTIVTLKLRQRIGVYVVSEKYFLS